jgi:hypothetical protein
LKNIVDWNKTEVSVENILPETKVISDEVKIPKVESATIKVKDEAWKEVEVKTETTK